MLCSILSPSTHFHMVGMLRFMFFWDKPTELAHSFLFCCVCFCLFGPFNCISFHEFSWRLSAFSRSSSGLFFCLTGPFNYMKVSFSPDIILCGWLGLMHPLTSTDLFNQMFQLSFFFYSKFIESSYSFHLFVPSFPTVSQDISLHLICLTSSFHKFIAVSVIAFTMLWYHLCWCSLSCSDDVCS